MILLFYGSHPKGITLTGSRSYPLSNLRSSDESSDIDSSQGCRGKPEYERLRREDLMSGPLLLQECLQASHIWLLELWP